METEQIKLILETRMAAAKETNNTTEQSLLFELFKMAEENENLKRQIDEMRTTIC